MNKFSAKRVIASFLFTVGFSLGIFVIFLILSGKAFLTPKGTIILSLCVCIPIAVASSMLISTYKEDEIKLRSVKYCLSIILAYYSFVLIGLLFRNGHRQTVLVNLDELGVELSLRSNFIPFKTIFNYINSFMKGHINTDIVVTNLIGNLVVFMPMGILLPSLFKKLRRFIPFVLVMVSMVAIIELLQLLLSAGSCDIDDLILNVLGAIMCFGVFKLKQVQKSFTEIYILAPENE
ncbi:MAG: VanZ family protein [Bacteroidales bacterium]|nr:VanZ family protein [Bacteroidales bacterium]